MKLGCEEGWDKGLSVVNVGGASGLGKDLKIPGLAMTSLPLLSSPK